jgi:hypothetical protein
MTTKSVTKEMIGAGHDVLLATGHIVLSAVLLERIYLAMEQATTQPQREWVTLTDEELSEIYGEFGLALMPVRKAIASAIAAKLREKNGI